MDTMNMKKIPIARRTAAVVAASLLLAVAFSSNQVVQARGQSHGLPGTWFISVPGGLTGFYTYHQDGAITGTVSTIFGAPPQPPGPTTLGSADHGIWRQAGKGFEGKVYRIFFDSVSGDPVNIIEIRTFFSFDRGRHSASGSWTAALWFCPVAPEPCPDPTTTPPDMDITPPPPLNTFIQTRSRLP